MALSRLATSIPESPTLKLNEQARLLRDRGEPVINLTVGEPKNPTPRAAVEAVTSAVEKGNIKYSPTSGNASLKQAIVRYTEESYGRTVSPANVIVSSGAKHSLYTLLCTLLDPGDEVILIAPYWVSYPQMIKLIGATSTIVRPAGGFYPTLRDIEPAVTARTKAILVNSPNNPSGIVYPPEFVSDVVGFCESRSIYLVMDDIYHKLVFDGKRAVPGYEFTRRDVETTRVIVVNGVSKSWGMTGFRIGWTVASREIVSVMANVQGQTVTCVSCLLQPGAEAALDEAKEDVRALLRTIESNRDLVMRDLGTVPHLGITKPEGAFYVLPDFRHYSGDSLALCRLLLERALVLTVPGKEFGAEGHLRISFAGDAKDVAEGLARIRWALDPGAPREIRIGERTAVRDWN